MKVTLTLTQNPNRILAENEYCLLCERRGKWIIGDLKADRRACGLHVDQLAETVAKTIREGEK